MKQSGPVRQGAEFARGVSGSRLRFVSEPSDKRPIGTVVCVPAFAEEMNKTRHMCARMARLLAEDGWRVSQRDLLGCGDSSGDFADASWAAWIQDLEDEFSLADPNLPVWLWGVRAGALLAAALLLDRPQVNMLLWQPVASGAQHLQQFLRLHAGARIVGSAKAGNAVSPMQLLRDGSSVEVGGYELSPALTSGLERASFDVPPDFAGRIVWCEVSSDPDGQCSPTTARLAGRLREQGVSVEVQVLAGLPFWQTQEIEVNESLLRVSRAALMPANLLSESVAAASAGRAPAGQTS